MAPSSVCGGCSPPSASLRCVHPLSSAQGSSLPGWMTSFSPEPASISLWNNCHVHSLYFVFLYCVINFLCCFISLKQITFFKAKTMPLYFCESAHIKLHSARAMEGTISIFIEWSIEVTLKLILWAAVKRSM